MKAKAGVEYDGAHWIVYYPWSRWRKRRQRDEALAAAILDLLHSPPGKVWPGPLAAFIAEARAGKHPGWQIKRLGTGPDAERLRASAAKAEST